MFQGLKGAVKHNAPLGAQSWFRCGGCADILFEPADHDDLAQFLRQYPNTEPLTIIGGLANTIVRDGGIRGVTLRLSRPFSAIITSGNAVFCESGALSGSVASAAAKAGLGGLEFLSGIPGSIGGAIAMNAGAYGREVKDVLIEAHGLTRAGEAVTFTPDALNMTYRHTDLPPDVILTRAVFAGTPEDKEVVRARLQEIKERRATTQPIREHTGGSTFANPSPELRAWQVVDQVGGRDLVIGGARMSPMHCNFMINTGSATAADLEALGDELIRRARDQMGVELRWEIKRIGERESLNYHAARLSS